MQYEKFTLNAEYRLEGGEKWENIPLFVWGADLKGLFDGMSHNGFPKDLCDAVFHTYHTKIGAYFGQIDEETAAKLVQQGSEYAYRGEDAYITNPELATCGYLSGSAFLEKCSSKQGLTLRMRATLEFLHVYVEEPDCEVRVIWCKETF